MSYLEAIEDGIPYEKHNGYNWYYPPCRICESPVPSWSYLRGASYICSECKKSLLEHHWQGQNEDKKLKKYRNAVKRISKVAPIEKYEKAMKIVEKNLYKAGWFQSTEEIMVAIELIQKGYKINHQVQIFEIRVDFVVPELKVVLEVDGRLFHSGKRNEEIFRDELIERKMGEGWYVIRIDTENINKNITKLISAIKAVIKYRKSKKSSL